MTPESQVEAPETRQRATFGDAAEAAEFVARLEQFERGEISSEQYRQYRLSRGIYGQRQDGFQMVRVKIPQGVLNAAQLVALADCADRYSRGFGHVTTRQNLQFHFVRPEQVAPFMEEMANTGLTTREACSHTVRNVAGCAFAGVCGDSPFDVTPYGEMITRHFLRRPYGSGLPRKFKIAISGCEDDCAQGAINDIGIIGRVQNGQRGFKVLAGGGTATLTRSAGVLHDFLPADELLASCEAIARVFHAEGNRQDLKKARMKWAIKRLGWDGFRERYEAQFALIRSEGGRPLPFVPAPEAPPRRHRATLPIARPLPTRYAEWRARQARPQAQAGYFTATVWLRLGDISSRQLRALSTTVTTLGDGTARTTNDQNLLLRWVREEDLPSLWLELDALGLGDAHAGSASDVVTCPGAETCRIAVTASRGVAQLVGEHLRQGGPARRDGPDIKVSGCPNGCGQHHIAAIGLQGGTRHLGDKLVPQYFISIGGGIDSRGATFARLVGRVPARRVPEAIDRLIAHFDQHRVPGEAARSYFERLPLPVAKELLADLIELKESEAKPEDFIDLGSNVEFKVIDLEGECAQ